ncbi:MAG: hypothetical protein CTY18_11995 [Methylomonas sp.]|nr:MAG: hypothetical protein CTY18_11995 [Methylomonas sp.]
MHKKTRLSKAGNRHIRSALYMPALSAKQHDPYVGNPQRLTRFAQWAR